MVLTFIQITVTGDKSTIEERMTFPVGQDIQSVHIVNMIMPEGLKNITVQAINKLLLTSDQVLYNFTAVHSKPTKKGMMVHSSKQVQVSKIVWIFSKFISNRMTKVGIYLKVKLRFQNIRKSYQKFVINSINNIEKY